LLPLQKFFFLTKAITMKLKPSFRLMKLSLLTIAFVFFNQCARNPVTGKKQIILMSESQELALGTESNPQILAEYGEYPEPKLQEYLNNIGQRMAKISHRPNLPFHFKVVDSDVVNAFAVPGGYVYFTRGILAHFNNEAQLAGVLGHEIGHVTARHGAQQQSKQMMGQVLFIGAMIASPQLAQFGEQLSQGMQLLFLKFGRDHETQSDELGVAYSSKIGFDAKHMADFFGTLDRLSGGAEGRLPTFMSTHPDPGDRNKKVRAMAIDYQQKNPNQAYDVNRESYLKLIDGIIYGEDPKQGYVVDNVFYHPDLKFQFPIPKGWKYQNSPQQFQMASADGKAMMLLIPSAEKTPEAAAQAFATQYKLTVTDRKNTTINGLPAVIQVADQVPAQQQGQQQAAATTRIATTCILYNGLVYMIHGVSEIATYRTNETTFAYTMKGFAPLTDPARINVKPEKLRINTVYNEGTLAEILRGFGMEEKRHKELSVLNGMDLTEKIPRGTLIKTIVK
jgi:predicted Zn-dependent protease